jgi:hypothetical protein
MLILKIIPKTSPQPLSKIFDFREGLRKRTRPPSKIFDVTAQPYRRYAGNAPYGSRKRGFFHRVENAKRFRHDENTLYQAGEAVARIASVRFKRKPDG